MSTYAQIFTKNQYELEKMVRQSQAWFEQEARLIKSQGRVQAYYLMRTGASQNRPVVTPGEMYMFYYDAKHKDTLPYWDRFPLVFPFSKVKDGFLGLNLHYLPYHLRAKLLDALMYFRSDKRLDEKSKLEFSWKTIGAAAKYSPAKACVKHYLDAHVKSQFKKVDGNNWATAILLPVSQFQGAREQQVWQDSMNKI